MEGSDLREKRRALNLTQAELAEQLGVKANTVTRWENGVLKVPRVVELAMEALGRNPVQADVVVSDIDQSSLRN